MTKGEENTIRNIIERLKQPNLGCHNGQRVSEALDALNAGFKSSHNQTEGASRIYLDTWIIGALECLLPGEGRDVDLAERLSGN